VRRCALLPLVVAMAWLARAAAADPPRVTVERVDGGTMNGRLIAIDDDGVRLEADGDERTVPLAAVRTIVRTAPAAAGAAAVVVATVDGGTLSGSGFVQQGGKAVVTGDSGPVELPIERVRRVAWLGPGEERAGWLAELPERPASDLVVVRRDDGHALVECAIGGVSADKATVVLDGETIPVKRGKLLGLVWVREAAEPGGVIVTLAGGRLSAERVRWTPDALLLDETVRLPAETLRSVDFAAGRTTSLAAVPIEKTSCEPFFGGLVDQPGLAAFLAPRTVIDPEGRRPPRLIVRPRTTVTWRIPADSRRFRGTLEREVQAKATVDVMLTVDGAEVFRRTMGGAAADANEPVAVDVDLAAGRRLTLTVDFAAGGPGCGVRLVGGAFEK